jgi:uncharacterized glyoxalase superfamily protein PhnB
MDTVIPEIGVSNLQNSIEFYSKLGFEKTLDGIVDDQGLQWCQMSLGDSKLWLQRQDVDPDFRGEVPVGNGVTIYLRVDDVDAAYESAQKAGFQMNIVREIETKPYNLREFKLCDLDGYAWTFYTPTGEAGEGSSENG